MPELIEQMYCSQQIVIPPKFPYILKRYCKAAIKTQPYDLLRWSFEYFKALSEHRPPPVKLRLEYPIYSTEGGLTRGCLKVLAHQLSGMDLVPLPVLKAAWQGFCLDQNELKRIMCLCDVYLREETVNFFYFIAVAGGMLTKCLTHTMILLCESLTHEPDGGSAAIPLKNFITMYRFLANMDASKNIKYYNGFKEGYTPTPVAQEEEAETTASHVSMHEILSDDFWQDGTQDLQRLKLIDDHVARTARLSVKLNLPVIGKIERSPSVERAGQIERENYMRERKGRPVPNEDVEKKLRAMSSMLGSQMEDSKEAHHEQPKEEEYIELSKMSVEIFVYDEEDNQIPYEIYGEPKDNANDKEQLPEQDDFVGQMSAEAERVALFLAEYHQFREDRLIDLEQTLDELAAIVDRCMAASYDLGMVAGRQMSTTSGEFIVQHIEKEIMTYINEQIAILPDPDLKRKKAKPSEVMMIREILEKFLDDNMDIIVPEVEEIEEEEQPLPEITMVYAVPGIGPPVDEDIMNEFTEYMLEVAKVQADVAMPRNIRHFLCPPLEKYVEYKYEEEETGKKEQVATGGVITD